MDFDSWCQQAWVAHGDDAAAVAATLPEGLARVDSADQLSRLAHLAQHLYGEHLGQWSQGRALLQRLQAHPLAGADDDCSALLRMHQASLALSAGEAAEADALAPGERIRAGAIAAANLASRDIARASALLHQALERSRASALPDSDPHVRALAVCGNNLACELEEKAERSDAERELMILAAQTGREYWARAGGWIETERAEYRLTMSWLQAGDPARAAQHARACLAIVDEHGGDAFERFFALEASARAAHGSGDRGTRDAAVADARASFETLPSERQAECAPTLAAIEALAAGAR